LIGIGLALLGRQSLEALSRRSALVTQLRFAVTLQDLRTVTLLRRQLSQERSRNRPLIIIKRKNSRGRFSAEWIRGWQGLLRFPLSRIARIGTLAIIAGLCQVAMYNGTTPAAIGSGLALFILGLEVCEPFAQEIDHKPVEQRLHSHPYPDIPALAGAACSLPVLSLAEHSPRYQR
jgi:hypothetical protein